MTIAEPKGVRRLVRAFVAEAAEQPLAVIRNWPGRLGQGLRAAYYRARFRRMGMRVRIGVGVSVIGAPWISVGDDVWIDDHAVLVAGPVDLGSRQVHWRELPGETPQAGQLVIGSRVHLAAHVVVQAHGGVRIGSELTLAAGSKLYSLSHHYRDPRHPSGRTDYRFVGSVAAEDQMMIAGPVVVENEAAVGLNAVLLPGTLVGRGSWVGVGCVVAGVVPAGHVVVPGGELRRKDRESR